MLTSFTNQQLKQIKLLSTKRKAREEQGLFVCEGFKMYEEAKNRNLLEKSYFSESFFESRKTWIQEQCEEKEYEVIKESVFQELAQTVTPQGVLALVRIPLYQLEELLDKKGNFLLLEDIQDPGNLGTMIRTAEAAGICGVIMSKGTVDLFNPKVVRSTMGSIYRMPYCYVENLEQIMRKLQSTGVSFLACHLQATKDYRELKPMGKQGILIGNEAKGLSESLTKAADQRVKIPMAGEVESLNAAVAAALLMYKLFIL